jgi:electron transfer flavoprotein beta subunit
MDTVVCIKQVPHPDHFSHITLDPVTKAIKREGVPLVVNPVDRHAIEAALQLRDRFPGKVTVLTMGPPQSREALEEALAMGADEGVLLCDRAFAGADAYATALTIAAAIRKLCPFSLVLCGCETADSGTRMVGPMLAEFLDIPYATNVRYMDVTGEDACLVEADLDGGCMRVDLSLPALITVNRSINEPRIPDVMGIIGVADKTLSAYGADDIGLPAGKTGLAGSPTRVAGVWEFKKDRRSEVLQGSPKHVSSNAVARLRELGGL